MRAKTQHPRPELNELLPKLNAYVCLNKPFVQSSHCPNCTHFRMYFDKNSFAISIKIFGERCECTRISMTSLWESFFCTPGGMPSTQQSIYKSANRSQTFLWFRFPPSNLFISQPIVGKHFYGLDFYRVLNVKL